MARANVLLYGSNVITYDDKVYYTNAGFYDETTAYLTALGITNDSSLQITGSTATGTDIWNYVNEHIAELKGEGTINTTYNLWSKMIAVYPFIGATASRHKYNLINPLDTDAAFRLTYSGTLTHNVRGVVCSNGFGLTKIIPSTHLLQNDVHISNYLEAVTTEAYEMGIFESGKYLYKRTRLAANPAGIDTGVNSSGFRNGARPINKHTILTRLNSSVFDMYTGASATSHVSSSSAPSSFEFIMFGLNNTGALTSPSPHTHCYNTVGLGMTASEAIMFQSIVADFQLKLRRG